MITGFTGVTRLGPSKYFATQIYLSQFAEMRLCDILRPIGPCYNLLVGVHTNTLHARQEVLGKSSHKMKEEDSIQIG